MDDLVQLIGAWKYMEYRKELDDSVSPCDYIAINLDGEIISRATTKYRAELKAIARGEKYPIVISGYEYLRIWKNNEK